MLLISPIVTHRPDRFESRGGKTREGHIAFL
jgi:hypothetical protein